MNASSSGSSPALVRVTSTGRFLVILPRDRDAVSLRVGRIALRIAVLSLLAWLLLRT